MNITSNATSIATQRVIAARAALVLDQPFFGVLALQLRLEEDSTCDTAWVDGRTLGYSPAFVATLTAEELTGLIAHEVLHCAFGHPWRRSGRDHKLWNIACDYAINSVLRDAGFILPAGALLSDEYSGHHAEWIYDRCGQPEQPQPQPQPGSQPGQQQPGSQPQPGQQPQPGSQPQPAAGSEQGEVRDAPIDAQADPDALTESDWQEVERQAEALGRGSLSAATARILAELQRPLTDWRSALRRFLQEINAADYSWQRPNVRYLASGIYLPALRSEACGSIVVAVDTSGSIDRVLLTQFGSELRSIVEELQPRVVYVIYCDSEVCGAVEEFGPNDTIELSPRGGGGTRFGPVFERIEADGIEPAALVYFTDLDGPMPDVQPSYPVLWACSASNASQRSRCTPPTFGDVIDLV
jgi:predicted metal-dependent peptidase